MKQLFIVVVVAALAWGILKTPSISEPESGLSFEYVVHYSDNAEKNDALPLLIALHGNGDTPENFIETALDQFRKPIRIVLLKGPISMGMNGGAWPSHPEELKEYGEAINEVAGLLSGEYNTKGKPMVLGFSGGGAMAYYLASTHPDQYSYIFPISGRLSEAVLKGQVSPERGHVRVYAFHGIQDRVVSVREGRKAVALLKERQVSVTLKEFKGGHQGIFTNVKSDITQLIETKMQNLKN